MTELYLKKNEGQWTRVFFDSAQPFRLTRENPYFQQSDSYTLDVTMPMDILDNRQFFGSLNRKDVGKRYTEYSCRLIVGNVLVMDGTAHLTQVTQDTVKVQLSTGVSALKMSAAQEAQYIDELDLGLQSYTANLSQRLDAGETYVNVTPAGWGLIFHDTDNDELVNICIGSQEQGRFPYIFSDCPKLLELARRVAGAIGYSLDLSVLPEACSHIYVVSGAQNSMARKLPHWTVKEFFQELQNFFGSIFISEGGRNLKLVPLSQYSSNAEVMLEPVEEYSVEYSDDDGAEGIINQNVEYSMDNGDTETVDEELLAAATSDVTYQTRAAMESAFNTDSEDVKTHKLYRYGGHIYVAWKKEGESGYVPRCVAPFNALKRFEGADTTTLKIAPAHIEEDVEFSIKALDALGFIFYLRGHINVPAVQNVYPLVKDYDDAAEGDGEDTPTMQGLIEGTESLVEPEDKPDSMSVVFVNGQAEQIDMFLETAPEPVEAGAVMAYTDYDYKPMKYSRLNRTRWSFSLQPLENYDFYMGQLHVLGFECNRKVKHVFKFLADQMPDPTNIFVIRNKRYGCEKIEANVNEEGYDKLMTGYFYEMS